MDRDFDVSPPVFRGPVLCDDVEDTESSSEASPPLKMPAETEDVLFFLGKGGRTFPGTSNCSCL